MSVSARPPYSAECSEPGSTVTLAQRLADELAQRWADGEQTKTEDYLKLYPEVARRPEAALELIYEEMCQQRRAGDEPRAVSWIGRFPQWRPQIEKLLACRDLLEQAGARAWFPEPGEKYGEFQLLGIIGHGAHGRVYLARQPALADRPVVLKLASLSGQEHLSLARLQHTYIMPLYWAQDDAALGLRALCMPYFGGAPLSQLLALLAKTPPAKRTGNDLVGALISATTGQNLTLPVQGPACRYMAKVGYIEAMCTLGACLAEALDYAHERNVVHHDLKPSNVLVSADGQPLLLDFHLAQPELEAGAANLAWLGGTPGYMAPEHAAALAAISSRKPIPQCVDGRADIYSLGVLLCEALAGELPPVNEPPARWLRRKNPQVSPALAALLNKCLAHEASHRYPNAGALAADLHRHAAQQPLEHVANRSLAERWRKWRRRRPYGLLLVVLAVAFATACFFMAATVRQTWHDAETALQGARVEIEKGRFDLAKKSSEHGLSLAGALPWRGQLWQDLQTTRSIADQGDRIQQLHSLVAELRARYGPEGLNSQVAEQLESKASRLWKERDLVLDESPESQGGDPLQVKDDLVDLALFWAAVQQRRVADDGARRVAQDRIEILQEGERLVGARLIFCREIERLAKMVGNEPLAAKTAQLALTLVPASGWEHYALGRSDLNFNNLPEADAHFKAAVDMNPKDLWPNFYHAKLAYELEQYEEAVTAFTVCIVLSDRAPDSYYYRGLANVQLERYDDARHDFDCALELDPDLADAALQRGMLAYREGRYEDALSDLNGAASAGANAVDVAYGRARVYAAKNDRASALHQLDILLTYDPNHEDGQKLANLLHREDE